MLDRREHFRHLRKFCWIALLLEVQWLAQGDKVYKKRGPSWLSAGSSWNLGTRRNHGACVDKPLPTVNLPTGWSLLLCLDTPNKVAHTGLGQQDPWEISKSFFTQHLPTGCTSALWKMSPVMSKLCGSCDQPKRPASKSRAQDLRHWYLHLSCWASPITLWVSVRNDMGGLDCL